MTDGHRPDRVLAGAGPASEAVRTTNHDDARLGFLRRAEDRLTGAAAAPEHVTDPPSLHPSNPGSDGKPSSVAPLVDDASRGEVHDATGAALTTVGDETPSASGAPPTEESAYSDGVVQSAAPDTAESVEEAAARAGRMWADALAARLQSSNPAAGAQLRSLGRAAFDPDAAEMDKVSWSGMDVLDAFDPRALAAQATAGRLRPLAWLASFAEFVRNFLVFVPVLVTWIGLGIASAAYATCQATGSGDFPSFLYLWQRGFSSPGVSCGAATASFYGVPLGSFGDVVLADALVLAGIILLTVLAGALNTLHSTAQGRAASVLTQDLRAFLVDAARRLHLFRAAHDANTNVALFVSALGNLELIATEFAGRATQMVTVLETQSKEAGAHLGALTDSYREIARDAKTATTSLAGVLESTTGTAHALAAGVQSAATEFASLGTRFDASALELRKLDQTLAELVKIDGRSQKSLEETARNTSYWHGLIEIEKSIKTLSQQIRQAREKERIVLPRAGWQLGLGALGLLALFQLLTVFVVLGDRTSGNEFAPSRTTAPITAPPVTAPPASAPASVEPHPSDPRGGR
jgi:hypothetical protein